MHITAFTPAIQAQLEDEAVTAWGLPMVFCNVEHVEPLPVQMTVPIVLSLWAEAGEDLDPHFYIVARDPDGQTRGGVEHAWHCPDPPGKPYKFMVFADYLQLIVPTDGIYKVGLYDHPEQTKTKFWFPLEVCVSPQAPPPGPRGNHRSRHSA